VQGQPRRLPSSFEQNLLRLGQEALTNAVRHADARQIAVILAFDRGRVRMTVSDDGHGIPSQPPRDGEPHQGMGTMRTRAMDMGAELEIDSSPRGTTISVEVIV
jgi:signal transduction histidine kinase